MFVVPGGVVIRDHSVEKQLITDLVRTIASQVQFSPARAIENQRPQLRQAGTFRCVVVSSSEPCGIVWAELWINQRNYDLLLHDPYREHGFAEYYSTAPNYRRLIPRKAKPCS